MLNPIPYVVGFVFIHFNNSKFNVSFCLKKKKKKRFLLLVPLYYSSTIIRLVFQSSICREQGFRQWIYLYPFWGAQTSNKMSLACLVCHGVESPSQSFRSYSVSSSENEGRCSAIANCLTRKMPLPHPRANTTSFTSSKVTPQPTTVPSSVVAATGPPRLVRSRAVRRDLVRDWNFDEALLER